MKNYKYTVGTPDATKLVDKKSNPSYLQKQNVIESIKSWYERGDTSDYEWQ